MPSETFSNRASSITGPADRLVPVVPDDDTDLPYGLTRGLHVGTEGVVTVLDREGNRVELRSGAGQYHPVRVIRVLLSGTTSSGIVALY